MSSLFAHSGLYLKSKGVDSAYWNNSLGTGLSMPNRIKDLKDNLLRIEEHCDKICIYSKWFYKLMLKNGIRESKLKSIPPALPYMESGKNSSEKPENLTFSYPGSIKLIFAGRISPFKGLHLLLEALKEIPEDKIELSIYGKEDSKEYLNNCKKISEGKKNIHWRGVLSRNLIIETFKEHDVFCLPSTFSEMSPLVIQESFEAGIPIIASKVYGNMEHIKHQQNGLLFDFNSISDFAEQLKVLIDMPSLLEEMKSNIKPPIKFNEVGEIYLSLYRSDEETLQMTLGSENKKAI
jgi:glycosyltransferase involved in cell wall biosynthesis